MPGLELIGPIAGVTRVPAATELEQGFEEYGMFIAGDARDVTQYSGMELGTRWICRLQGPGTELIHDWPTPGNETWRYHPAEEAARVMYGQLRNHLFQRFPGVQPRDARDVIPLNVPTAAAESFWQNGKELFRLFYDRMSDLQIAIRNTDCIRRFAAHPAAPDGPGLVSYFSQNDTLYLAIARGATGAAVHVCIVFSMKHEPQPVISQGMPRAGNPGSRTPQQLQMTSGFLVAFWGRCSGGQILAPAGGQDPAAMLHGFLGQNVVAPLQTNVPGLDARLPAPAAYVVRVEPGEWEARYLELDANADGGWSFLALSKKGAPPFQPYVPGNAGGQVIGGMTLEQYAMMTCERERALMMGGANAGGMLAQVCAKYGQPVPHGPMGVNVGYAARIVEWDQEIAKNASLSAQFIAQKTVAQMRLNGIEPDEATLAQIKAQQDASTVALQQGQQAHQNATKELREGALAIIEKARSMTPPQLLDAAKGIFKTEMNAKGTPAHGFYTAIAILKSPGGTNPRIPAVDQLTEKLAQAHWLSMSPEDQKFEGSEKGYIKEVIADVYEKNGLPVPGIGGFFSRLVDKM